MIIKEKKSQLWNFLRGKKILKEFFSMRAFFIFLKLFDSSWLAAIIIIFWQIPSKLIKLKNWLSENTIGLYFAKMLKPILKVVMSI